MTRSLFYCGLAYAVALAAAVATADLLHGQHPLLVALAADVVATLVVFGFSLAFNNSSFYDPYWSVAPVPLAIYFALQPTALYPARAVLELVLVTAWSARLTFNFLRGWGGLDHEDWRYVDLRSKTGRAYWPVSLLGIHLFPTLMVFAGCLPIYAALSLGARPLNLVDGIAAAVAIAAITLEAIADAQLRRFRLRVDRAPEEILDTGLWAWSRHPNYFGEMLFWWALWLFALAAGPGNMWTVVGAAAITLMFRVVSLRLLEARMVERRPGYAAHIRDVPAFVPYRRPRKQRAA